MGFVGQTYPLDVFISYSHGDVRGTGEAHFLSWSRCFREALGLEIDAQFGDPNFTIFFDSNVRPSEGIDPNAPFDAQLEQKAKGAAIFLALISHNYPASKWCERERDWWRMTQAEN